MRHVLRLFACFLFFLTSIAMLAEAVPEVALGLIRLADDRQAMLSVASRIQMGMIFSLYILGILSTASMAIRAGEPLRLICVLALGGVATYSAPAFLDFFWEPFLISLSTSGSVVVYGSATACLLVFGPLIPCGTSDHVGGAGLTIANGILKAADLLGLHLYDLSCRVREQLKAAEEAASGAQQVSDGFRRVTWGVFILALIAILLLATQLAYRIMSGN